MAHIKRDAEVQYGDYTGTAAADSADAGFPGIYEAVTMDRERWWILAVEIYAAEPAELEGDCVRVFALDKASTGVTNYAELQAYGSANGQVPVTEFVVHDISAVKIVRDSFKRLAVQLRTRSLEGIDLEVIAESDLNYTDS